MRWRKRQQPTRQDLIDRKHRLEGEIRALASEVSKLRARGADVDGIEARLARMRHEHHQTRLRIDRTGRD
jgi:hypothetical protein